LWQDATTESVIKATKSHFTQHLISHMITHNGPQYSSDQFGPCSYLIKTDNGPCTDEIVSSSVKTLVKDIRSPSWPIAAPPIGVHLCQSQDIPTWPYNERRKDIDAIHKWLPIHYSFVLVQISLPRIGSIAAISRYKKWQSQLSPIKIRRLCWIDDLQTNLWDELESFVDFLVLLQGSGLHIVERHLQLLVGVLRPDNCCSSR